MKEFAPLDALFLLLGCRVSRSPLSLALASDSNALILILILILCLKVELQSLIVKGTEELLFQSTYTFPHYGLGIVFRLMMRFSLRRKILDFLSDVIPRLKEDQRRSLTRSSAAYALVVLLFDLAILKQYIDAAIDYQAHNPNRSLDVVI